MPRRPGNHVDSPAEVGRRLREARERAGVSQRQLAFDGCTSAYISRVEGGFRTPSLQILRELARRLGTTAEYLATGGAVAEAAELLDEADVATRLGRFDEATKTYEHVLASEAAPADAARARMGLAEIAHQRGKPRRVVELLEGLALVPGADPAAAAWMADRLGRAYAQLGDYESSLAALERGLVAARERGDELAQLRLATLFANAVLDRGNAGRAAELLADALQLADRTRDPLELARIWWAQSRLHIQQQRPDLAARYIRKTIALLDAREHEEFARAAFQLLARIENDRGNHDEALALVERGAPCGDEANGYHLALFEVERARALAGLGEVEEGGSVAMRAAALLEEADPASAGRSYGVVADVFRRLGDAARAQEVYELAAERLDDADPHQAEIHAALGELLEERGDAAGAMRAYKRAAQVRARTAQD
jgi:tetratricopeptide (TPR) repeat protein